MNAQIKFENKPENHFASAPVFNELCSEANDVVSELQINKGEKSDNKLPARKSSVSENFFVVKGANLILPKQSTFSIRNVQVLKMYGGELQVHLRAMLEVLRKEDKIRLAVRLESLQDQHRRYLVVIKTLGRQDTEENVILGCDFKSPTSKACTIGICIPIWSTTKLLLDGDGGFKVIVPNKSTHTFKPVSVQAMWCAYQNLHRCVENAQKLNYYEGSLYLTWECYYKSHINSNSRYISEWQHNDELWSSRIDYLGHGDPEMEELQTKLAAALKDIMSTTDLDECTSRQIRMWAEQKLGFSLNNHKKLVDQEMFKVLGQLETASKILDYIYLGSEWNAMHLDGLKELKITHILNVTKEIDNFFPQEFTYKNVLLMDIPTSDLRSHWNSTCRFIETCRSQNGRCLVHCKMGISRSASTVAAYLIQKLGHSKQSALNFIKERRPIANPNEGFLMQLTEWEGIVSASSNRHNNLFRAKSVLNERTSENLHQLFPTNVYSSLDVSINQTAPFDLNRKLLELNKFTGNSNIIRAKSWSPEENVLEMEENTPDYLSLNSSSIDTQLVFRSSDPGTTRISSNHAFVVCDDVVKTNKNVASKSMLTDIVAFSFDSVSVQYGTANIERASPTLVVSTKVENIIDVEKKLEDENKIIEENVYSDDTDVSLHENSQIKKRKSLENTPKLQDSKVTDVKKLISNIEETKKSDVRSFTNENHSKSTTFKKGHYKTKSLPPAIEDDDAVIDSLPRSDADGTANPAVCSRERSFSEVAPNVRTLVTAIEKRSPSSCNVNNNNSACHLAEQAIDNNLSIKQNSDGHPSLATSNLRKGIVVRMGEHFEKQINSSDSKGTRKKSKVVSRSFSSPQLQKFSNLKRTIITKSVKQFV